jgi:metal-responsive CopG/Arc/MetJ family transcriptional regulator
MHTLTRTSTTEMEVTSIRLERELKEELKALSGNQGYQALIRDILWNYVQQRSGSYSPSLSSADIRATFSATAQTDDRCALTGSPIHQGEHILLGLTIEGNLIPLSPSSLP